MNCYIKHCPELSKLVKCMEWSQCVSLHADRTEYRNCVYYLLLLAIFLGEVRNAYSVMVGKPEGKRPFGRHRHRWILGI